MAKLLKTWEDVVDTPFTKIFWLYGFFQSKLMEELQKYFLDKLVLHEGFNETYLHQIVNSCDTDKDHFILIIDDLLLDSFRSPLLAKLYSAISHHKRISILSMGNTVYLPSSNYREALKNATYIFLTATPKLDQVQTLARQCGLSKCLVAAYSDAMSSRNYSYILLSQRPFEDQKIRIRGNIFPDEGIPCVWIAKNS